MREKVKWDPIFRQYLLDYISQIVEECIPDDNFLDEEDDSIEKPSGT